MVLCLCSMVMSISCGDQEKGEHTNPIDPDTPGTKDDGINYITGVKHIRTFADALAPVTNEYAITYTAPDADGHKVISEASAISYQNGTESHTVYTYAYDEEGTLIISASFEGNPDKEYTGDFRFNRDGTIKRFARLKDNAYSYYAYSYNLQKQLSSNVNKPFDAKGGFWDIQWEDGNATAMKGETEETEETPPVRKEIECTFGEYENNYSIDINGLIEDFMHHNFGNPIMPLFKGMTCRNLVSRISGDINDYIYSGELWSYTRFIESSIDIRYETDMEGRVVKMTLTKESKAVKKPENIDIDDEVYYNIPSFNYTETFEFTYD